MYCTSVVAMAVGMGMLISLFPMWSLASLANESLVIVEVRSVEAVQRLWKSNRVLRQQIG